MRKATLKSYLKNNLNEYLNKYYKGEQRRASVLLRLSYNDSRLAELAQGYFMSLNKVKEANAFSEFTNFKFKSFKEFGNSNFKYADLFRRKESSEPNVKDLFRKKMLEYNKKQKVSFYRMSLLVNISQSNLKYFLEGDDNKLSLEKAQNLLLKLKEYTN